MKIWIIQTGEPTPTEFRINERLMRSGLLSKYLAERGHTVTWWASTFDHARKEYRYSKMNSYRWSDGITIRFLHSKTPYTRNVSWSRIINHRQVAESFRNVSKNFETPDLILSGMPTPELCVEAVRIGKKYNIPILLDIRDLWPDDIVRLAPWCFKAAAKWALRTLQRDVTESCQKATGICATSKIFVDWGLSQAQRTRCSFDKHFPLGYSDLKPTAEKQSKAKNFWENHGIIRNGADFILCFFGALGATCLLRPVMDAVRLIRKEGRSIKLVICGKGDRFNDFKRYAKEDKSILMAGWVGRPEIWHMMQLADVGLVPVKNIFSYMSNYPNKTIEYMSSGLPVLSSLNGIFGELVKKERIGLTYHQNDAADLSRKICRLIDNPSERKEMGKNARLLYEQRFTVDKVYGGFAQHIETVIRRKT